MDRWFFLALHVFFFGRIVWPVVKTAKKELKIVIEAKRSQRMFHEQFSDMLKGHLHKIQLLSRYVYNSI